MEIEDISTSSIDEDNPSTHNDLSTNEEDEPMECHSSFPRLKKAHSPKQVLCDEQQATDPRVNRRLARRTESVCEVFSMQGYPSLLKREVYAYEEISEDDRPDKQTRLPMCLQIEEECVDPPLPTEVESLESERTERLRYFSEEFNMQLDSPEEVFIEFGYLEVKTQDFIRLAPKTFLNDTLINFFLKLITELFAPTTPAAFLVPNTYFFLKLEAAVNRLIALTPATGLRDYESIPMHELLPLYPPLAKVASSY